jgi:hypothetical protein
MKKIFKHIKVVVAFVLLIITLSACDSWLSIAPENDLIKEKFWSKKEDAEGGLASAYDAFRDAALESFIWGELRADFVEFNHPNFGEYENIASSNINPTNGKIKWNKYYEAINLANTYMHFAPEVMEKDNSFTKQLKNEFDSEALFIRSLSYFYLVRVWKEVPLVTEASISDQGDLFTAKNTEKEVINQIITDLLKAKDLAVTEKYRNIPEYYKGRANKYSIMALLADVYLWDEQYQKASDYCDSIINTGLFNLVDLNNWFTLYYPGNAQSESIFEIQFNDNLESQENPLYNELYASLKFPRVKLNDVMLSTIFDKTTDNRIKKSPLIKYGQTDNKSGVRSSSQRDANFIYYRYADVLLAKAEALTEMNQLIEANALVKLTKERAGLSHTEIVKQKDLRQEIVDERGREFVMEGKRWFDLLRNAKRNKFENKQIIINMILSGADIKQQAILRTRVYDTMSYYLPIPENELLYNPQLVQNPFYER